MDGWNCAKMIRALLLAALYGATLASYLARANVIA